MNKLEQICTVEPSYKGWVVYDNYWKMTLHQTQPPYKTKREALQEAKKLNKEYTDMGVTEQFCKSHTYNEIHPAGQPSIIK